MLSTFRRLGAVQIAILDGRGQGSPAGPDLTTALRQRGHATKQRGAIAETAPRVQPYAQSDADPGGMTGKKD